MPTIAVPSYTYDVFSITAEGTGGMFRAYRGDIGYVHDPQVSTRDKSGMASLDYGWGQLFHAGVDVNVTRSNTKTGAWVDQNTLASTIGFKKSNGAFEASYFRNPGEKAINTKAFYEAIGGDDVVAVHLQQPGDKGPSIIATNWLNIYKNKNLDRKTLLTPFNVTKSQRDKRAQVISYLTAEEARVAGLSKYIENYALNQWDLKNCGAVRIDDINGEGVGLKGEYFRGMNFEEKIFEKVDPKIDFYTTGDFNVNGPGGVKTVGEYFSVRWTGRLRAEETGTYTLAVHNDDGVRVKLNDSTIISDWHGHSVQSTSTTVNLIAGELYTIVVDYFQGRGDVRMGLYWKTPSSTQAIAIPKRDLCLMPAADTFRVSDVLSKEKRINAFRKANHISEIDVLNPDGRRYIYGLPVYNLKQKDVSFSVNASDGNSSDGLVSYNPGVDNSTVNSKGGDHYYSSDEMPAYAHSFLLTGILSPDYADLTGDGISDDDPGNGVKFNYTKIAGLANPYQWRAPYSGPNQATYNEGKRTDNRDDRGSYVYGEKELWYLHSIESKTMIATFKVADRADLLTIDENGVKNPNAHYTKRLEEINLYSKADFLKRNTNARPIKTVHFEYSYELCRGINAPLNDSGKLTLKRIWFSYNGNNKGKRNAYVFTYHTNNPRYNIKSYDRWGNYKDPLQNPGSTSGNVVTNAEYPYALQDSVTAAYNAAAWTLDSICLPSGGRIKVTYESDDYAYVQNKRAMQLLKVAGFALNKPVSVTDFKSQLYTPFVLNRDNLYAGISVPDAVSSNKEVMEKYLEHIDNVYFKLYVRMPGDKFGSGYEYVNGYATLDLNGGYGFVDARTIWVKLKGISLKGDKDGDYSPMAKTAIQFLRLNLPSKAYPGSDVGEDMSPGDAVKVVFSMAQNYMGALLGFDAEARIRNWAYQIDASRSFVRVNNPTYKKYGGGLRVKQVKIYDHWNSMTGQKEAVYGQEYQYSVVKDIHGVLKTVSSGVASYEPLIGGEENPWRLPIQYTEQAAPLAPVNLGYVEEPLGESFFPSAGVGYSKVRVRSISTKNKKSANGYEETGFYTSYDFPVLTDRTTIDGNTKKRYRPPLANFLKIDARHYLVISQGFKVELNDMNGKVKYQATYPESDPGNPISYTENFYRVDNSKEEWKHLNNTVMAVQANGDIDSAAIIGKDAELMVDMREQRSVTNANNFNMNIDGMTFPIPPIFLIPSALNLPQREENLYQSAAVTKIIQRYGILDSVMHIEKGSKVKTENLLFDSETGDVVLTRSQNEFNDPVYNFTYPAHWAYDALGGAYKNIQVVLKGLTLKNGKITAGLPAGTEGNYFTGGDEVLVYAKQKTGGPDCSPDIATFPRQAKLWVIDTSALSGGAASYYFIDANGQPFTGNDISLKVIRSGRKNIGGAVGTLSLLENPLVKSGNMYVLKLDSTSRVLNAAAAEYKQLWKVADQKKQKTVVNCVGDGVCDCLKPLFDYLISSHRLLIRESDGITVRSLVNDARSAGFFIDTVNCSIIRKNLNGLYYEDTVGILFATSGITRKGEKNEAIYRAKIGYCTVSFIVYKSFEAYIYDLKPGFCFDNKLYFSNTGTNVSSCKSYTVHYVPNDTLQLKLYYTDCNLIRNVYPLSNTDSIFQFCAFGVTGVWYPLPEGQTNSTGGTNEQYTYYNIDESDNRCNDSLYYPWGTVELRVESCTQPLCDTIYTGLCYSAVTDTATNPFLYGIAGNWRPHKSYAYYSARAESDAGQATNIKANGTIAAFVPFWSFQGNSIVPRYDTTRWVWNSESALFNQKGFELENKDPLGRYNAGLYGYEHTLPTAVTQNSRYRESAFEGFEDYDFASAACDNACPSGRHLDFSAFKSSFDSSQRHSGRFSLRVGAGTSIGLSATISDVQGDALSLKFGTSYNTCASTNTLTAIKADRQSLLPGFSPLAGKKLLFSAWVKEDKDCKCEQYNSNQAVFVVHTGSTSISTIAHPSGAIIEGWQRYETVIDLPADASLLSFSLQATGSTTVYFDDVRLHPFNANMKSFVYDAVNLRLMAELDENNYASFYEYDDDGTLIRVKKETARGIKTIKETRSALLKETIQ